jgi:O-antigen/teichoic acid export membrane protein
VVLSAAPSLIEVLYGPPWLPAAPFLRLLAVVSLVRPVLDDLAVLLGAVGRPRWAAASTWSGAIALLVLGPLLTFAAGGIGTAVAVGIAYLIAAAVAARLVSGVVSLPVGELVGPVTAALLAGVAAAVVVAHVAAEATLLIRLALEAMLPGAAFAGVLIVLERDRLGGRLRDVVRLARSGE